jgi:hypothetical protein
MRRNKEREQRREREKESKIVLLSDEMETAGCSVATAERGMDML